MKKNNRTTERGLGAFLRPALGFALAPILYIIALAGIAGAVLFTGYTQILRSNVEITADNNVRNQIRMATEIIAAQSAVNNALNILVPPAAVAWGTLDPARLPKNAAGTAAVTEVATQGAALATGGLAAQGGIKQLDPWGRYYIMCRWEGSTGGGQTDPSLSVISAGADGNLATTCDDIQPAAGSDDKMEYMTVANVLSRSANWQAQSMAGGRTGYTFGIDPNSSVLAVGVDAASVDTSKSLDIGGAGRIRGNLNVNQTLTVDGATTLGGTLGVTGAATLSNTLTVAGATAVNNTLAVTGATTLAAVTAGATTLTTLNTSGAATLGGTLDVTGAANLSNNLTVGGTATMGVANITTGNITTGNIGTANLTTGNVGTLAVTGASTLNTFTAASGAVSGALNAGSVTATTVTGTTGVFTNLTATNPINGSITGSAGSVDGSAITGIVPLNRGGTGVNASSNANLRSLLSIQTYDDDLQVLADNTSTGFIRRTGVGTVNTGPIQQAEVPAFGGASAGTASTLGGVPIAAAGQQTFVLTAAGTWVNPTALVGVTDLVEGDSGVYVDDTGTGVIRFQIDGFEQARITGVASADRSVRLTGGNSGAGTVPEVAGYNTGGNSPLRVSATGTGSLALRTNGVDRFTIDSSGNAAMGGSLTATGGFVGNLTGNAATASLLLNSRNFSASGDVTASAVAFNGGANLDLVTTVARLQGRNVSSTAPNTNEALIWNGTAWAPASITTSLDGTTLGGATGVNVRLQDGTAAAPSLSFANDTNTGLYRSAADELSLSTAGTQRVVVDSAGDVGIGGITAPVYKLHVGTGESIGFGTGTIAYPTAANASASLNGLGANSNYRLALQDGNGRVNEYWNAYRDTGGNTFYVVTGEPATQLTHTINGTTGGDFYFRGAPAGTAGAAVPWVTTGYLGSNNAVYFSPRGNSNDFYIDSAGNTGIGTSTPGSFKLNVNGNTNITGNLTVSGTVTGTGGTGAAGSDTHVQYNNSGVLGGISALTFNKSAATPSLGVVGSSTAQLALQGAGGQWRLHADNGSNLFRIFDNGSNNRFQIDASGNVGIGGALGYSRLHVGGTTNARQITTGPQSTTWLDLSSAGGGGAMVASNAYIGETDNGIRYATTHGSIGASGMIINGTWGNIDFFTGTGATTAGSTFSPSYRMTIAANGNIAIGNGGNAMSGVTFRTKILSSDNRVMAFQGNGAATNASVWWGNSTGAQFAIDSINGGGAQFWTNNNGAGWNLRMSLSEAGNLDIVGNVLGNAKEMLRSTDSWLRLNQAGNFTSGVYTPGLLRVDGEIQGNAKQMFVTNDTYLRINQSSSFTGGIWFGSSHLLGSNGIFAMGSNGSTTTSRVYINGGTFNGTNVINLDGATGNAYFAGNVTVGGTISGSFSYTPANNVWINSADGANRWYFSTNSVTYIKGNGLEFRNSADTPIMSWANGGSMSTNYSFSTAGNAITISGVTPRVQLTDTSTSDTRYVYSDAPNIGFLNNAGNWSFYVNDSNQTFAYILYDMNNTAYYIDPASTSITNDFRANIFYDFGNTAYYLDPNGNSNLYTVYINEWVRVYNSNGIYWQTYGGGWNMQDTTYIRAYGNKYVLAAGYYHTSDARLKHDIRNFRAKGLDVVAGLRTVHYKWNSTNKDDLGVLAQEVQKVLPEAVHTDEKGFMQVQYDKLVLPVIEAVKELHAMLNDLTAKVAELLSWKDKAEQRLQQLEDRLGKVEAEKAVLQKENAELKDMLDRRLKALEAKPH